MRLQLLSANLQSGDVDLLQRQSNRARLFDFDMDALLIGTILRLFGIGITVLFTTTIIGSDQRKQISLRSTTFI